MERSILTLASRRGAPIVGRGNVDPRTLKTSTTARLVEAGRLVCRGARAEHLPVQDRAAALRELGQQIVRDADRLEAETSGASEPGDG